MEGFEVGRALRHDGPAGQRPEAPLLQGRPHPAGERARRARRGLQDRHAHPQQRPDEPRHRLGGRHQGLPRPDHRPRQRAQAVRPPAGRLRAGPGQDRLDGLLPVRAGGHDYHHDRPGRPRRAGLLARVGDREGGRHRVPLVRGQPGASAAGPATRRALREGAARHPHLPDLRGRQRRDARLHRPVGDEAAGRRARRGRQPRSWGTRSAASACWPTTPGRVKRGSCPTR